MDSLYSTANSTFLATACGKCILLLGRWLGQSEEVDHTIQIFRDNLRLLRDVLEAFDRSEKKEFDEIAVSTNLRDPNFLWSQLKHVRIVAAIVLGRLDDVLVSFCPADLGDLEKLGHQFKKSIDSGDLAVLRQRVVLLSGALNLPLQMMSFHTQTENAVRDEAVVEQLSMKINDIQTSIRTLHSQIENVHETDYLNQDLGLPLDVVNLAGLADELSTCAVRHWRLVANTSFLQEDRCDQACSLFYTILVMIQNMSDLSLFHSVTAEIGHLQADAYCKQWKIYEAEKELNSLLGALREAEDPLLFSAKYCLSRLALNRKDYLLADRLCSEAANGRRKVLGPCNEAYHQTVILLVIINLGLKDQEKADLWKSSIPFDGLSLLERFIFCGKEVDCLRSYGYTERAGQIGCDFLKQNYVAKLPWPWEPEVEGRHLNWTQLQLNIEAGGFAGWSTGFATIHYLSIAEPEAHLEIDYILRSGAHVDAVWTMPGRTKDMLWRDCTSLISAAGCGHLQACRTLLFHGAKATATSVRGRTALFLASSYGHVNIIEELLLHRLDINLADEVGDTPLSLACFYGGLEAIKYLFERGARCETVDDKGYSPMHLAAEGNHWQVLEFLTSKGMNVEAKTHTQQGPAHRAATMDSATALKFLLENGAELEAVDDLGETPLHSAAYFGCTSCVKLLIDRGANVNVMAKNGESPLHLAVLRGHVDSVELLLSGGADVNSRGYLGDSPLHRASLVGHTSAVKLLIARGANVQAKSDDGSSPLHIASEIGHIDTMSTLITSGSAINAVNQGGDCCLHRAAFAGNVESVNFLLRNNACPVSANYPSDGSKTVLNQAILGNSLAVVQLLVAEFYNQCVNWVVHHPSDSSPIHIASREGRHDILQNLLRIVPDDWSIDDKILSGYTALHLAAYNGQDDCIQLLTENGASVQCQNSMGNTPLHLACRSGHATSLKILVDAARSRNNTSDYLSMIVIANNVNSTPILEAVRAGHDDCVLILLEAGATIPAKKIDEHAAFDRLHRLREPDSVEILLDYHKTLSDMSQVDCGVVKALVKKSRSWVEPLISKRQNMLQPSTVSQKSCGGDPLWICCNLKSDTNSTAECEESLNSAIIQGGNS